MQKWKDLKQTSKNHKQVHKQQKSQTKTKMEMGANKTEAKQRAMSKHLFVGKIWRSSGIIGAWPNLLPLKLIFFFCPSSLGYAAAV